MLLILFVIFVFNSTLAYKIPTEHGQNMNQSVSSDKCVPGINKNCNNPTTFKDEELENLRQFLNNSFTVLADIKPDKPLCPKLHVRQDWDCLTQQQKDRVHEVWKIMFLNGDIQKFSALNSKRWQSCKVSIRPVFDWIVHYFGSTQGHNCRVRYEHENYQSPNLRQPLVISVLNSTVLRIN